MIEQRGRLRLSLHRSMWLALMSVAALTATTKPATALTWNWSFSGAGIAAGGTFTTVDTPDGSGFYLITGIAGVRNGAAILGLQPAGTPIPGNEPFSVDNLVRLDSPQLTVHGFGYAIAEGTFSNPFFANFLQPPEYLEFFSAPPITPGGAGPEDSELPIRFSAALAPVAQPPTWVLLLVGLGMRGLTTRCRRHCRREQTTQRGMAAAHQAEARHGPSSRGRWEFTRGYEVAILARGSLWTSNSMRETVRPRKVSRPFAPLRPEARDYLVLGAGLLGRRNRHVRPQRGPGSRSHDSVDGPRVVTGLQERFLYLTNVARGRVHLTTRTRRAGLCPGRGCHQHRAKQQESQCHRPDSHGGDP